MNSIVELLEQLKHDAPSDLNQKKLNKIIKTIITQLAEIKIQKLNTPTIKEEIKNLLEMINS